MTIDLQDQVERDHLAPAQRLHVIADILADGVRRLRGDARHIGEGLPQHEAETTSLALSEPTGPCGGRG